MAKNMGYNLTSGAKEYSRYFGNFRGVDFSSDHTQVADTRFSYLVNMYKDYRNGQGGGVETFPGFRKIPLPDDYRAQAEISEINDIKLVHIGENKTPVFILLLEDLYEQSGIDGTPQPTGKKRVAIAYSYNGEYIVTSTIYYGQGARPTPISQKGSQIICFEFGLNAYIVTNRGLLKISKSEEYEGLVDITDVIDFYVPTTYTNIPLGNAYSGSSKDYENEQRNLLSNKAYNYFVGDGVSSVFYPLTRAKNATLIRGSTTWVAHTTKDADNYIVSVEFGTSPGGVFTPLVPNKGEILKVELSLTADGEESASNPTRNTILGCTIAAVYDNRVFLSGNPGYPNHIFWCGIPDDGTGIPDPTYWGELNYVRDGIGSSPIMGMIPVADTLCVLKADTIQDGSVYYHSPSIQDGNNITPVTYPSVRGLSGQGLIAKNGCANFRDDPVFITAQGLDAIGQLSVRYERATEHRSSIVDTKLRQSNLENARLTVWNGYLILYTDDGKAFLADSRATYGNVDHNEYEWYYLEDLGAYSGQSDAVRYGSRIPEGIVSPEGITLEIADSQLQGDIAGAVGDTDITVVSPDEGYSYAYKKVEDAQGVAHYYYCEYTDFVYEDEDAEDDEDDTVVIREKAGGTFHPATAFFADGEDLYMATGIGLFKFNFDLRNADGSFGLFKDGVLIYARDGRAFTSGCATKMDNCGIPHLVKTTSKKSLVIKTRSELPAVMKVKVRTNKDEYRSIDRLSDSNIDFSILDFADMAFTSTPRSIFAVSEKEKKWVEKQYYVYNDEFNKNFCLIYIAYRYSVSGKYKNK